MGDWVRIPMKIKLLLSLMISSMKTETSLKTVRMPRSLGRKGREGWRRTPTRGIISVAVERATCPMLPFTPMPKLSTRGYSPRGLLTFRRRASRALVPTVGRLTAATAICSKPMSTIRGSRSLLIWWSGLKVTEGRTPMSASSTSPMNTF